MDAALLDMMRSGRNSSWAESMVNLEARKLINTANTLSSFHLGDGLTRMAFAQEMNDVVERQFAAARRAKTDEECMLCEKNLMAESVNLQEQDRLLRTQRKSKAISLKFSNNTA